MTASVIAQAGPEVGYGVAELGLLTSLFFLTAAVSSSRVGNLVERIGWYRAMRFNAMASTVALLVIALFVGNVWTLGAVLVVSAAAYGTANPAANLSLANYIPHDRRGLVFGIKHAGIPTSTLVAGSLVPMVVLTLGWRAAYATGAAIAFALFFFIPKPHTRQTMTIDATAGAPMQTRWLAFLSLGTAFATLAAGILGTFHVDAALAYGFDAGTAGWLLAAASMTSIMARAIYGWLADRVGASGLGWVAALALIGALSFFMLGPSSNGVFAAVTLLAFATGWGWPGLMTYGVVRANSGRPAGSTAITQAGIFVGAGAGPYGFAWVIDNYSYTAAWNLTGISLMIAAALISIVRRQGVPNLGVNR